jgi:hypothetical protein
MKRKQKSGASRPSHESSNSKTKTGSTSSIGSRVRQKSASTRSTKSVENIPFGGMDLTDDYKEFIESLNAFDVRYRVVGGYAVGQHGHPRYTRDMDVWVWIDQTNAENVIMALKHFGFGSLNLTAADLLSRTSIVQLGYEPDRIDLITDVKNVTFEECYERRTIVNWMGVPVNVIGVDDLVLTKKGTGRLQDLADIEQLGKKVSLIDR